MHEAGRVKNHRSRSKSMLFLIWKELQRFQVKEFMFILKKKQILIKTKWNRRWKIPHTLLDWWTLCFSSYKNRELKMKLWWVEARERKKGAFFVTFILLWGNFCSLCVLSQCMVYWRNFQKIYTYTYHIFKIVKSLQCILKYRTTYCKFNETDKVLNVFNICYNIVGYFWILSRLRKLHIIA